MTKDTNYYAYKAINRKSIYLIKESKDGSPDIPIAYYNYRNQSLTIPCKDCKNIPLKDVLDKFVEFCESNRNEDERNGN